MQLEKKIETSGASPAKRPSKGAPSKAPRHRRIPRIHARLEEHEACKMLMAMSTKVEGKGKVASWIHDPEAIAAIRGMIDAKQTYRFRIWAAPINATVSSNITAGAFGNDPIALPEFSGILSVLFDEYRVDEVKHHIRPIAIGGSTSGFDKYAYAISNAYLGASVPTTWEICLAYAESALVPVCASSGSGFFAFETQPQGAGVASHAWRFHPPRILATAGSTAALGPYIPTTASWPGQVLVYAETTATNGTVVMSNWREFHLSFRMRR